MTSKLAATYSYIPPELVWSENLDIFAIEVSLSDSDLVGFVVEGRINIDVPLSKNIAKVWSLLLGDQLRSKLMLLYSSDTEIVSESSQSYDSATMTIFWHGTFILPGEDRLLVLVGVKEPSNKALAKYENLINQAVEFFKPYQQQLSEFDTRTDELRKEKEEFHKKHPELKKYDWGMGEMDRVNNRPLLKAESLKPYYPKAICFCSTRNIGPPKIMRESIRLVEESGWLPPREGVLEGLIVLSAENEHQYIVSWQPYAGLPAYPEVRWTLQKRMPSVFIKPRYTKPSNPLINASENGSAVAVLVSDNSSDWLSDLSGLQANDENFSERVSRVRAGLSQQGFEAIAWYQPYHLWSEDSWGIYIDAAKLDDLALAVFSECRQQRARRNYDLCAQIAFGLIYHHEIFHARIEASLSWLEINAGRSKYRNYQKHVYQQLSGTDDWLEEALANWTSWQWSRQFLNQTNLTDSHDIQKLNNVVEATLDMSPAGYNNWRSGHQVASWRRLTTQMVKGVAIISPRRLLPLESILAESLPYDLKQSDIPMHFVGQGDITDRIQTLPSVINVPARKEIERALRYFRYNLQSAGGKGSHEKWLGPDNRAFILPQRDPLSRGVFKTFLDHFNLDKMTYARQIRPNL